MGYVPEKFKKIIIQQTAHYLASKVEGLTKTKLFKLLFFAERYHLRKYADHLIPDTFFAMQYGPVPSITKDLCSSKELGLKIVKKGKDNVLLPEDECQYKFLSDSTREALDFVIKNYGHLRAVELKDISHEYQEWKRFEEFIKNTKSSYKMKLIDFFLEKPSKDTVDDEIPENVVKRSMIDFFKQDVDCGSQLSRADS